MVAGTMLVIAQDLNDSAVTDTAMATFLDHALELPTKRPELAETDFDLFEMGARNGIGGGATGAGIVGQLQQFADFLDPETEFSGMADELQPLHIFGAIEPVASICALEGLDQPDLLIVSNCLHFSCGQFGKSSNGNSIHLLFSVIHELDGGPTPSS